VGKVQTLDYSYKYYVDYGGGKIGIGRERE